MAKPHSHFKCFVLRATTYENITKNVYKNVLNMLGVAHVVERCAGVTCTL